MRPAPALLAPPLLLVLLLASGAQAASYTVNQAGCYVGGYPSTIYPTASELTPPDGSTPQATARAPLALRSRWAGP